MEKKSVAKINLIPKELEPLAKEARKYKNAEDFARDVLSANLQSRESLMERIRLVGGRKGYYPSLELKDAILAIFE